MKIADKRVYTAGELEAGRAARQRADEAAWLADEPPLAAWDDLTEDQRAGWVDRAARAAARKIASQHVLSPEEVERGHAARQAADEAAWLADEPPLAAWDDLTDDQRAAWVAVADKAAAGIPTDLDRHDNNHGRVWDHLRYAADRRAGR